MTTLFQTEKYIVRISCGWNQGISLKMEDSTAASEGTTEKRPEYSTLVLTKNDSNLVAALSYCSDEGN